MHADWKSYVEFSSLLISFFMEKELLIKRI